MTATERQELKLKDKQEVTAAAEQTTPGLVFTPDVDIFETDTEITLLADMPGVQTENLVIDLRDDVLTLTGDVYPFEGEQEQGILIEYEVGRYYRQFTLSEVIDQDRIDAELKSGVLRLILPKVKKASPRRIAVKSD